MFNNSSSKHLKNQKGGKYIIDGKWWERSSRVVDER